MARADLLVALVQSGAGGDELAFRRAAEAIIAEENAKKHGVLASQLAEALTRRKNPGSSVSPLTRPQESVGLLHETEPLSRLNDLVLPTTVRQSATDLIEEHHRRDLLRSHGVEPRHRILLEGPPGSGKTTLAEAIASEVAVPLLTVRYEGLIGSFLGETASRLDALFSAVRIRPCVLFFDEFDAVAKERGDTHETGEIKRVVSSLLLQVEPSPEPRHRRCRDESRRTSRPRCLAAHANPTLSAQCHSRGQGRVAQGMVRPDGSALREERAKHRGQVARCQLRGTRRLRGRRPTPSDSRRIRRGPGCGD